MRATSIRAFPLSPHPHVCPCVSHSPEKEDGQALLVCVMTSCSIGIRTTLPLLYHQCLEKHLARSRCSVNTYSINKRPFVPLTPIFLSLKERRAKFHV